MSTTCQRLSPPPPQSLSPHHTSSTNLRSALTFNSLGRRRSSSFLQATLADDPPPPPPAQDQSPPLSIEPITTSSPSPSMLVIFASRFLEWMHVQPKHTFSWSTPSSPRSSTDDYVLPLSASAHTTSFGDDVHQTHEVVPEPGNTWRQYVRVRAPILFVVLLFPISTALVLFCLSTLPISLAWPRTIADVAQLGRELHGYTQSGPGPIAHVVGVMAITAIWKHAWSIPGSVIWNVLAGALFSPAYATVLLTTLTMFGSACATMLSTPLAPFLTHFFPRALDMTRNALEGDSDSDLDASGQPTKPRSSAWVRLSVLRLIGVVPWSGINIACGVCGVPLADCMLGAFIGSLPWTAVTCQIGDILQTVASTPSPTPQTISSLLTSPEIILKLVFLSFLSLAPILGRGRLRALISNSTSTVISPRSATNPTSEEKRWTWVQEWRSKIRLASRSRTQEREQSRKELEMLVQEKRALEDLPS
ncbi:snare associated Golgi protein-domain-containing protein [Collybia nuda]|uniref:Snare associated Golgi protein-domain-containing protein n=1 Tax=Collybia nuda TaxID=64659 RepID=A0A9P5Y9A1_9AGAR|nr:snare associated Golgi protein-domain-containing protein [Collybia nuda]